MARRHFGLLLFCALIGSACVMDRQRYALRAHPSLQSAEHMSQTALLLDRKAGGFYSDIDQALQKLM